MVVLEAQPGSSLPAAESYTLKCQRYGMYLNEVIEKRAGGWYVVGVFSCRQKKMIFFQLHGCVIDNNCKYLRSRT